MPAETDPLKSSQGEKRESFRIDDTLPIVVRKIEEDILFHETESMVDDLLDISPSVLEKENISPILWKMLIRLDRKLDRLLEKTPIDLLNTKAQPVNLSSTGIKVKVNKKFDLDELVRIKLLLPTLPVKELVVEGKVVRIDTLPDGKYEVGLRFYNLGDKVKDEIINYTLTQQRKIITGQRQKRGQDESNKG